ncbi:MAG: hypothetical protein COW08_02540 [Ignavibacteriales bacterium CG12_big_fil_rev_8_21_14_0_65_30_8]|nr:MAG: hypothetical protein COW08_02540 [Ignavibacteriales bacterium CG12_big_fil_rev_8_21_14_0_65_30_8]
MFTFDDGYQSQYDNVFPLLNSYGFKGTFYVIGGSMVYKGQQHQPSSLFKKQKPNLLAGFLFLSSGDRT